MRYIYTILILKLSLGLFSQELTEANCIYQFKVTDINGKPFEFSCLEGEKIMIVNTASKCMYAPQLFKLQELYTKYKDKGFIIIAFPSRSFYNRELKSNDEIVGKYKDKYKITFPIMGRIEVKGDSIQPLYEFLSHKDLNGKMDAKPKWNFHKYLINKQGFLYKSLGPTVKPFDTEIIEWIEKE